MPYGAAETMWTHEVLGKKINAIDHLSFYYTQCRDPQLKQMLDNHLHTAIQSYNSLVSYSQGCNCQGQYRENMSEGDFRQKDPDLRYGLRQPNADTPQINCQSFNDRQIASALLNCHKSGAKDCMAAAVECADEVLREMMTDMSVQCCREAYDVFMMMNQKSWYQIPTLNDQTARTFLGQYKTAPTHPHNVGVGSQGQGYRSEYNNYPLS